jgi:predicted rRNA methylase YqxC with S4 and FtsJ domains
MNWKSTKFLSASFVQVTGAIALFVGKVDGGTYVALSSLALGIYAVADVAHKKLAG